MTDVKKCAKCVHYGVMYNDEPCRTCDGDSKYEYDVAFPERFSWMFKAALKNQEKPKEEGEIVTEEIKETEEKTETTTEVPVSEETLQLNVEINLSHIESVVIKNGALKIVCRPVAQEIEHEAD